VVIVYLPVGAGGPAVERRPGRLLAGALEQLHCAEGQTLTLRGAIVALAYVPRRTCARHHSYLDWHPLAGDPHRQCAINRPPSERGQPVGAVRSHRRGPPIRPHARNGSVFRAAAGVPYGSGHLERASV